MKKLCTILSSLVFMLGGCSSISTIDYANKKPELDIRKYLSGDLEALGILYDYSGKADLEFKVTMKGSWAGNQGKLEEFFTYSDGRKDHRTWQINFSDDHNFIANAHDVEGNAVGTQHGNSVNMKYVLNAIRSNGDAISLTMDDWMYLLDDKTLINRTKMKKFGLTVGELVITFRKL